MLLAIVRVSHKHLLHEYVATRGTGRRPVVTRSPTSLSCEEDAIVGLQVPRWVSGHVNVLLQMEGLTLRCLNLWSWRGAHSYVG